MLFDETPRVRLARLPTPLEHNEALSAAWGGPRIWFKRDDLTGFGLSGNKVRKLEFHLGSADEIGADTLITCGAAQSNHCRATAVAAARLGLRCHLFLRTPDGTAPRRLDGNHRLALLAGAEISIVDPEWYSDRDVRMERFAASLRARGRAPWVIPEGASDGVGMRGYTVAAAEAEEQLRDAGVGAAYHWHGSSSGGTTAGLAAGLGPGASLIAASVSDSAPALERRIAVIWEDAGFDPADATLRALELRDDFLGRGYGLATAEELETQLDASRRTGLIFDPTYTGKALHGLKLEIKAGRFSREDDIVFWHTGGGFAALAFDYGRALER